MDTLEIMDRYGLTLADLSDGIVPAYCRYCGTVDGDGVTVSDWRTADGLTVTDACEGCVASGTARTARHGW